MCGGFSGSLAQQLEEPRVRTAPGNSRGRRRGSGLFDAGADQVIVWDNHNGSLNLSYDLLVRAVRSLSEWDSSIVGPG